MTQARAEIVEAMVSAWHSEVADCANPECEACNRAASAALDIALKAAAEIARNACLVPPDGGAPTKTESEMCDRAAEAILVLTSEGTKG